MQVAFTCRADLPVWPTANGPSDTCTGEATGLIRVVSGTGSTFTLTANQDPIHWTFALYNNTCSLLGPLVVSNFFGRGKMSLTGLRSLNGAITGSISNVDFEWPSIMGASRISLRGGTVSLSNGVSAPLAGNTFSFSGAAFMYVAAPLPPPDCSDPAPVTVRAAGALAT